MMVLCTKVISIAVIDQLLSPIINGTNDVEMFENVLHQVASKYEKHSKSLYNDIDGYHKFH